MPATAGRIRMPANNRLSVSDSLRTTEIWQKSVGYDPYAPSAEAGAAPAGDVNTDAVTRGILALARLSGKTSGRTPGGCKKCGQVGHLSFQCRNRPSETEKDILFDKLMSETALLDNNVSKMENIESSDSEEEDRRREERKERKRKRHHRHHKHKHRHSENNSSEEKEERKKRRRRRSSDDDLSDYEINKKIKIDSNSRSKFDKDRDRDKDSDKDKDRDKDRRTIFDTKRGQEDIRKKYRRHSQDENSKYEHRERNNTETISKDIENEKVNESRNSASGRRRSRNSLSDK